MKVRRGEWKWDERGGNKGMVKRTSGAEGWLTLKRKLECGSLEMEVVEKKKERRVRGRASMKNHESKQKWTGQWKRLPAEEADQRRNIQKKMSLRRKNI